MSTTIDCPVCGYPLKEPASDRTTNVCEYCHSHLQATPAGGIRGVEIPTPVIVGLCCFIAGALLGPSIMAATEAGSQHLAELARQRAGGRK